MTVHDDNNGLIQYVKTYSRDVVEDLTDTFLSRHNLMYMHSNAHAKLNICYVTNSCYTVYRIYVTYTLILELHLTVT